jgi:hypothetical protein
MIDANELRVATCRIQMKLTGWHGLTRKVESDAD